MRERATTRWSSAARRTAGNATGNAARTTVLATVVALVAALTWAAGSGAAQAVVPPVGDRTATGVTADALPTVQIDGVVWSQAVVGNTVYAGGSFANARPAGAASGTNLTPRGNLLAYNLSTGELITSFAPTLNAQVKSVVASPDGSRIYVGGSFTTADGQNRYRLAAYSTATGALISSFAPTLDATVNSITVSGDVVYAGGVFGNANGVARSRLAAFSATTGALLNWAPTADSVVDAVQVTPDGSKVVVGGAFQNLDGSAALGLGALDATTGAQVAWAVNQTVQDYGTKGAILSLSTDGTSVYGTGYDYGSPSNFEGVFSADPSSGAINWLVDCHGDSYGAYASGSQVYVVSHEHFCSNVGGFPETNPRTWHRTTAFSTNATGTTLTNSESGSGYGNFAGQPSPSMLNWFPTLDIGSYTGQSQAAWTVTGTSKYVVEGGEFMHVNGTGQQGLVRFAVPSIAPDKQGPQVSDASINPTVTADFNTAATITWPTNWDPDNDSLTYALYRNSSAGQVLVYSTTAVSQFWNRPTLSYRDTGLTAGTAYTYFVRITDPDGNSARSADVSTTTPTNSPRAVAATDSYGSAVYGSNPSIYWRLDDASGAGAADSSDYNVPGVFAGGYTQQVASPVTPAASAVTFNGATGTLASSKSYAGPTTYSEELWFRTTTTRGGRLIGFGDKSTGTSSNYDRLVYMQNSGQLVFGAYPGKAVTVTSPGSYNNGAWHYLAATQGGDGMKLYVDGALVGSDPNTGAQSYTGYWRVGGDGSWGGSSNYFAGSIDEVAVYPTNLSLATVRAHYRASSASTDAAPSASFTSSCTAATCAFDAGASADTDGTVTGDSWNFGDGTTGSGVTTKHSYQASGTYTVTLTTTDDQGATGSTSSQVTVTVPPNTPPSAAVSGTCSYLACHFDGSASTDPDGSVASYAWDFGDGSTSSDVSPAHSFTAGGTYQVQLTVTDNRGGTGTATKTFTVVANKPPTASFTSSCTQLKCSVDATASSDADGSISGYAWTFGDGSSTSGPTATHSFPAAGTYRVTLTVTDDQGATGTSSASLTVSGPVVYASDAFARSTASGWGTADTGGAWTVSSASLFGTASGVGSIKLNAAGAAPLAKLSSVSATNETQTIDVSADKAATGSGYFLMLQARATSNSYYALKLRLLPNGVVHLVLSKVVGGTETVLREVNVAAVTYAVGDVLRTQFGVTGDGTTTNLTATVWKTGSVKPSSPQVSLSDNDTALQGAGAVGVQGYLSGTATNAPVVLSVDNYGVTNGV